VVLGSICVASTAQAEPPPTFATKWGTQGSGPGQFQFTRGIATDAAGNVYVVDTNNNRVQKFDSDGNFLLEWGSAGSGDGQFTNGRGASVDAAGNVYVGDNARIQVFTGAGAFLFTWGSLGSGDGQFFGIRDVLVDDFGNVWVSDSGNDRLQKFTSNGTYLSQFGSFGTGDGQFDAPWGLGADADGNLYVVDSGNERVQKFDSTGTFITKWGALGSADGEFDLPLAVNSRIQKFDGNGVFLSKWGTVGMADGQFSSPDDITLFGDATVYVADASNHRVQKFIYPRDLQITSFVSPAESRNVCSPVPVTVTVANTGTLRTGSFEISFRLSTDSLITTSDALLGVANVDSVSAGGDTTLTLSLSMPITAAVRGSVFLGAIADDQNDVTETDETNNTAFNAFTYQVPIVESAVDIPGDQGGQVFLSWWASPLDDPLAGGLITQYSLWRAMPSSAAMAMIEKGEAVAVMASEAIPEGAGRVIRLQAASSSCGPFFWELVEFRTPYYIATYGRPVPTWFDSTSVSPQFHYFQVIAHTSDPLVFYISNPDSGRSVDDLAPATPQNPMAFQQVTPDGVAIRWDPNVESDLAHYAVYRSTDPGFTPGPANLLASPSDTTLFDADWRWDITYYYKISAVDAHENESGFAAVDPNQVTGVDDGHPVARTYLEQNHPNPFNPRTTIHFALAADGLVVLEIFDPAGRLVKTLLREQRQRNRHSITWDGTNNRGEHVASGIYLYRLTAGSFAQTRKMILLK
jgi:hypothetical protein